MKKIIIVLFVLVLLLVTGVVFGPGLVDWNKFKPQIATKISGFLGRDVVIEGDLSFTAFPTPILSVKDVKVLNIDGGSSTYMIEIDSLELTVDSKSALFSQEIEMEELEIVNPNVLLEVVPSGEKNWNFDFVKKLRSGEMSSKKLAEVVKLNQALITNATVTYHNRIKDNKETIEGLSGTVSAKKLTGPYDFDGTLKMRARPLVVQINFGAFGQEGGQSFTTMIVDNNSQSRAVFNGKLWPETGVIFKGSSELVSNKPKDLMPVFFGDFVLPDNLNIKFLSTSDIVVGKQKINMTDVSVGYGENRAARGQINIVPSDKNNKNPSPLKVSGGMRFATVDGDMLLNGFNSYFSAKALDAMSFALPAQLDLDFKAEAQTVSLQESFIREARLDVAVKDGVLALNKLSGGMPGDTNLDVAGTVTPNEGKAVFDGSVNFESMRFKEFMSWRKWDIPGVSEEAGFRQAKLIAKVGATRKSLSLSEIDAAVDSTNVSGSFDAGWVERLAFSNAALKITSLNLDAYMDEGEALPNNPDIHPLRQRFENRIVKLAALNDFDFSGRLVLDSFVYGRVPMRDIKAEITLKDGKLKTDTKIANAGGAQARVVGGMSGFGATPVFDKMGYIISSKRIDPLLGRLGLTLPVEDVTALGEFSFKGQTSGTLDKMASSFVVKGGGATIKAAGTIQKKMKTRLFDLRLDLSHMNFTKFVNIFNKDYSPVGGALGIFKLKGRVTGNPDKFQVSGLDLGIKLSKLTGNGAVDLTGERPKINGTYKLNSLQLSRFMQKRRFADLKQKRPFEAMVIPAGLASSAMGNRLDSIRQSLGSHPWLVQAQIAVKKLIENPGFTSRELDLAALSLADLDMNLTAESLKWENMEITDCKTDFDLVDSQLTINSLNAKVANGNLNVTGVFSGRGIPVLSGKVDVTDATINNGLFGGAIFDIDSGTFKSSLTIDTKGASQSELVSGLNVKGNYSVANGQVSGFSAMDLKNAFENKRDPDGLDDLIENYMTTGKTPFESFEGDITVNRGGLRSLNSVMRGEFGTARFAVTADLSAWTVDTSASFSLSGISGLPPFEMKLSGSLATADSTFKYDEMVSYFAELKEQDQRKAAERAAAEEAARRQAIAREQGQINEVIKTIDTAYENAQKIAEESKDLDALTEAAKIKATSERARQLARELDALLKKDKVVDADVTTAQNKVAEAKKLVGPAEQAAKETERLAKLSNVRKLVTQTSRLAKEAQASAAKARKSYSDAIAKIEKLVADFKLPDERKAAVMEFYKQDEMKERFDKLSDTIVNTKDAVSEASQALENARQVDVSLLDDAISFVQDFLDVTKNASKDAQNELERVNALLKLAIPESINVAEAQRDEYQEELEEKKSRPGAKRRKRKQPKTTTPDEDKTPEPTDEPQSDGDTTTLRTPENNTGTLGGGSLSGGTLTGGTLTMPSSDNDNTDSGDNAPVEAGEGDEAGDTTQDDGVSGTLKPATGGVLRRW